MLGQITRELADVFVRLQSRDFACEWKYDGQRAQIHMDEKGHVALFSRNLESLRERRIRLKEHFTPLRTKFDFVATMDASGEDIFHEKVQEFFRHSICHGSEGIMVKVLDHPGVILQDQSQRGKPKRHLLATYEPDKRVENWLKVKKDYVEGISDTLDLIPIGAWYGNGRKVNWYSPILMACYNPENETLESVCKCMSGFSDKFYEEMKEFYSVENNRILSSPRQDYVTDLQPDVWFDACQVWEIKGADVTISPVHKGAIGLIDESKGLSLRFPRFLKIRDDKALEDATSSDMLASLYLQQQQQPKEEESRSVATNTLLVPNVPRPFFFCPSALTLIRNKFEEYGAVHDFIAMKGFGRLMIIYEETMSAMAAREAMDKTTLLWKAVGQEVDMLTLDNEMELEESMMAMAIRIYYGQHNPINPDPNLMRLQIPDPGRNFLISPPGAPFEDWKQTQESPPNKAVLASDLMHAVADVSDDDVDDLEDFSLDRSDNDDDRFTPTLKIVLGEEPAEHLPVITVQDFDGVKGELDTTKKNNRLPFPKATVMPTPRPPLFS
ncbi:hypothetical protein DFQ30_004170 [Apophysomyces sp. BC1015]|nr:hypothetical protein DFQ30_004170 [Apophysomyces sp. BC1015]